MPFKTKEARNANQRAKYSRKSPEEKAKEFERSKLWKRANRDKAQHTQEVLAYQKANPLKVRAIGSKYRAAKLQRIPAWAEIEEIKQFYLNCPQGYEVDHIIPLQGKDVSGLHVLSNLQYLTKSENSAKGNRYEQ